MPTFDIIITSWNRLDYLKRTIASLMVSGAWKDAERIIIVDNGSTEIGVKDFLIELQREFPIFLVMKPNNKGWGQAVNDALGLSRAEYIFLSNNDVEYTGDFHNTMLKAFGSPLPGINHIGILGVWRHTAHGLVKDGVVTTFFDEMDNVPAVGWMMPKRAMEEVGMINENGPCFTKGGNGEDTAYVNRMKEAGYLVGVTKNDIATHIDGY